MSKMDGYLEFNSLDELRVTRRTKMPPGGVMRLKKSKAGRELLAKMQRENWKDILQPSDPRFEKVWGHKQKRYEEEKRKREDDSKAHHHAAEWGKNYKAKKAEDPGFRGKYL
jgi:hypothetical protein